MANKNRLFKIIFFAVAGNFMLSYGETSSFQYQNIGWNKKEENNPNNNPNEILSDETIELSMALTAARIAATWIAKQIKSPEEKCIHRMQRAHDKLNLSHFIKNCNQDPEIQQMLKKVKADQKKLYVDRITTLVRIIGLQNPMFITIGVTKNGDYCVINDENINKNMDIIYILKVRNNECTIDQLKNGELVHFESHGGGDDSDNNTDDSDNNTENYEKEPFTALREDSDFDQNSLPSMKV